MAIQQVVTVYINLKGDGAASTFSFALQNLYQFANGIAVPFGGAGVVPTAVSANNPPVPVTSTVVDANGNITLTTTSPLPASVFTFQLDLSINSGASSSTSPTQTTNVTIVGSSATQLLDSGGTNKAAISAAGAVSSTLSGSVVAVSLTAVGQTAVINMLNLVNAAVVITSLGVGGTLATEVSIDNGVTWQVVDVWRESTEQYVNTNPAITVADSYWFEQIGAIWFARVRVVALTSGTISGTLIGTISPNTNFEYTGVNGSPLPNNIAAVGGSDGTNVRAISTDTSGRTKVLLLGNAAATLDATLAAGTAPTNGVGVVAQYNAAPPILTTGQTASLQHSPAGDLFVSINDLDTQPGILQKVSATTTGTATTLQSPAFANTNTAMNTIVVIVGYGGASLGTITVADLATPSNVYKNAFAQVNGTTFGVAIFYATNISSTAANKITVTSTVAQTFALQVYEVSGTLIAQTGVVGDRIGVSAAAAATNTPLSGMVSPAGPNSIAFQGIAIGTSTESVTTAGQGWTVDNTLNPTTPTALFTLVAESALLGSMGTSTNAYTVPAGAAVGSTGNTVLSGTNAFAAVTVSFRNAPLAVQGVFTTVDGFRATYRASTPIQVVTTGTAGTGVVLQIQGSATKIVRITAIHLTAFAATAAEGGVFIQRYSTTATAGTSAALPAGITDPLDPPATAVVTHWTATGGTAGTAVGGPLIADSIWFLTTTFAAPTSTVNNVTYNFGTAPGTKELILKGTTDFIALNITSATLADGRVWIEWTEE